MKQQLTRKAIFLPILIVILLVVGVGLAVTQKVGADKLSTGHVSLCTVSKEVTTLTVHRGTTMNPTTFSFPPVVFVGNATSAGSVAKAICAIPRDTRTGAIACPMDQGPNYRLIFTLPKYVIAPILLSGTGFCSGIVGTGRLGWIRPTPNFFRILGVAMQLHLATEETFAGKMT